MNKLAFVDIGKTFLNSLPGAYGGSHGSSGTLGSLAGVGSLVSLLVQGSMVLAGIILLFYFVIGGFGMIAGAGSNDPQKLEAGKKAATSALIGFIVVFAAYWIVRLIEYITKIPIVSVTP